MNLPQCSVTLTEEGAEAKLRSVMDRFVQRVSEQTLLGLLDKLLAQRVLTADEMEAVEEEKHRTDKARRLIKTVWMKGDKPSSVMMDIIGQLDRNLSDALHL